MTSQDGPVGNCGSSRASGGNGNGCLNPRFLGHVRVIYTLHENPSIALAVLPDDARIRFTKTGLQGLGRAAPAIAFVAMFGPNLPPGLAEFGIRAVAVAPPDPLSQEMLMLALGPHAAAAVAIRGFDAGSQLNYAVTYDRQHVTRIASHLLARIP